MMNKSRQQFEEKMAEYLSLDIDEITSHREDDKYHSLTVSVAWFWWQASRESLIDSLEPVAWMYPVFHDDKMQFTTDAVTSENIDIHFQSHGSPLKVTPLYRLD
ncbi:TPA: hypothetical protein ACXM5D_000196 [Proteus mirabilis]